MKAPAATPSLTRRTLVKVAIRIAVVVAIATVISYLHVRASLQAQALKQLEEYIKERGMRESNIFVLAEDNLHTFVQNYAGRFQDLRPLNPADRFAELFAAQEDGSVRLRERFFASHNVTGVIGKYVPMDVDLQRRLVTGFGMLAQYGPAWQNRFVNLYTITPENAVLMFWPGKPWGLNANSWEVSAKLALSVPRPDEVLVIDENRLPTSGPNWSNLYFDYAVNDWMVSVTEPVILEGRYLLSVGQDILLHELIERTINNRLEGTYNILFREDGRLLAHPRFMDAIQARSGDLSIRDAGDAHLLRISDLVKGRSANAVIVANRTDAEYLAVTRLQGPGWYLVTVFPEAIVAAQAFETARLVLILGGTALLLEIGILFWVLRKQVAEPLTTLLGATNRVTAGDFNIQLDERSQDEIGRLAHSFNAMSRELNAREKTLNERSAKLALLNRQLEQELEERKRAEAEIARQREALHQSEKLNALGSLLAGVAHELNNPLSIVVGRAMMLEQQLRDTPQVRDTARIRAAAERCARIVKTFLAMARQQKPAFARVALGEVLDAALEMVGYGLRADGVELELEVAEDLPELPADPDQLTQVFTNLLLNAQQALARQSGPRRLTVRAWFERAAQMIKIQVSDNGPGIPPEIVSRIFEPFFTTKPVGEGTGLGLSVSHGIVQAHGGTFRVVPGGQGATFELALPVQAALDMVSPEPVSVAAGPGGRSILVVDDEPEIAEVLEEILEEAGYRVETAENGRVALQKLAARPVDLIISDLRMPDMDGQALYAELKARWPMLMKRVVFVTGDTLNESARQFLKAAERPVIEKPFVPDEIRRAVARELEA